MTKQLTKLSIDYLSNATDDLGNLVEAKPVCGPVIVHSTDTKIDNKDLETEIESLEHVLALNVIVKQYNREFTNENYKAAKKYLGDWKPDAYAHGEGILTDNGFDILVQFYRIDK